MRFGGGGAGAVGVAIFFFFWAAFFWFAGSPGASYGMMTVGGVVLLYKLFHR